MLVFVHTFLRASPENLQLLKHSGILRSGLNVLFLGHDLALAVVRRLVNNARRSVGVAAPCRAESQVGGVPHLVVIVVHEV